MKRAALEMAFTEATVAWARAELELTDPEIGQALGADRKTVQRWRARKTVPSREHRRRMEKLNQLRHLLETSFRTPEIGHEWLHRRVPALQGRTPISVLLEGDLDSVISTLGTLASGAFV
ncbi:MAG: antitoxin Xre/MbcA/ParS toxin-binding domain-containing protein [Gemmatimonadaceae bacterium]